MESWRANADERRRQRQAVPQIDARVVLYERLAAFVVQECLAARGKAGPNGAWMPPEGWTLQALPERAKPDKPLTNLQESPDGGRFVESLNRYFGNVRAALENRQTASALLEPAVECFCDELDEAAAVRGDLLEKCLDLQQQVHRFAARVCNGPPDDDIPF